MSFRRLFSATAATIWGLALPVPAMALDFAPSQGPDAISAAIVADGASAGAIDGYAEALMSAGVAPGVAVEALLKAGLGTQDVVRAMLVAGGNDVVDDVIPTVLFIQGDSVIDLLRTTAYAVPGIDKGAVDRAIAIYLGNRHLPVRDPGATHLGDLPDRPISNY